MRFPLNATSLVILLTLALAGVGLLLHPGQGDYFLSYFDAWFIQILKFSLIQALLSAVVSVLVAMPFALLFSWRAFRGQWLLKGLLNLFFIMPVLTIILSVVAAFSDWMNVFSLQGIVLAHTYINAPYAIRIFWERQSRISNQQIRLAKSLNFSVFHILLHLKLPILIASLRSVFVLIFLLCFSSFTVVLTLSGGPANTNLELAIYQALKFYFDPNAAAFYAFFHGLIAFGVIFFIGKREQFSMELNRSGRGVLPYASRWQIIGLALLLLILLYPLASLVTQAASQVFVGSSRLWQATYTSLMLALGSGLFATLLALVRSFTHRTSRLTHLLDFGLLVLPTMVITTGLFLLALKLHVAFKITHFLIIWLNGLMAMPIILSSLQSRIAVYRDQYQSLSLALSMGAVSQFKFVYWPAIKSVLPWSMTLAMVLSVGDLGVAVLLGSAQFVTLPILIYQAMGSYQMVLASQLTLMLLAMCAFCLLIAEWLGERFRHA